MRDFAEPNPVLQSTTQPTSNQDHVTCRVAAAKLRDCLCLRKALPHQSDSFPSCECIASRENKLKGNARCSVKVFRCFSAYVFGLRLPVYCQIKQMLSRVKRGSECLHCQYIARMPDGKPMKWPHDIIDASLLCLD